MMRRFINVDHAGVRLQLHARVRAEEKFDAVPLVMLHAAPGSALMLGPLQQRLSAPSYAIDFPGMGDSTLLPDLGREPEIADYAAVLARGIRAVIDGPFDIYGTLSGVRAALLLAAMPDLPVRKLVLDGIGFPKPEDLPELLADYAPECAPDINGTHLTRTFMLCRDQYLFYPWYARDAEHRRPTGLPAAELLHLKALEAIKSATGFRPLIRAAFRYDCAAALKALRQPALISAEGAAVRPDLPVLTEPPSEPFTTPAALLDRRAAQIGEFLGA